MEDHLETLDLLRQELEFLGYEVVAAKNGIEGVEMAESKHPDLIIMDILMSQMDGLQATLHIRQNPKTKSIPILAATAKATPGDREQCLASGCDGYIAKPFTHRELSAAVNEVLEKRSKQA